MKIKPSQHRRSLNSLAIGVTGGIGSGKTSVTDFFANKGMTVVDADIAARVVVEPGKPALIEIVQRYGSDILINGSLDRRQLRTLIFDDSSERQWLENLLHPLIREQIIHELINSESTYSVLVSPLMLETNQHELVDRVLVVDVPEAVQIERTMARDEMTREQTQQIINSQIQREQRVSKADDVIDNSGSLEQLYQSLEKLHQCYLSLA